MSVPEHDRERPLLEVGPLLGTEPKPAAPDLRNEIVLLHVVIPLGEPVKITSKGQVTIPMALREKYGLLPETEVEFVDDGQGVRLVRAGTVRRGQRIVDRLRSGPRPSLSTDEIMALTRP